MADRTRLRVENFPPELHRRAKRMAVDTGTTLRRVVIDALEETCADHEAVQEAARDNGGPHTREHD